MKRTVVAAIFCCGWSWAQADELVDRADTNGDGFVSLYELRAAHFADEQFNRRIEQSFARYDRNGDGLISEDERLAVRAEAAPARSPEPAMSAKAAGAQRSAERSATGGASAIELSPAGASPIDDGNASRDVGATPTDPMARWIIDVDKDRSGGASAVELVASGNGVPWFSRAEFEAADRNGDDELNAAELGQLVRSIERRQR